MKSSDVFIWAEELRRSTWLPITILDTGQKGAMYLPPLRGFIRAYTLGDDDCRYVEAHSFFYLHRNLLHNNNLSGRVTAKHFQSCPHLGNTPVERVPQTT